MTRVLGLLVLFAVAGFSGCLEESDPLEGLRSAFGSDAVQAGNGTNAIAAVVVPVLEGRLDDANPWASKANADILVPKITLAKADPGPQGGGGVAQDLEIPESSNHLSIRFKNADKLGAYDVNWGVTRNPNVLPSWQDAADATKPFSAALTDPGPIFVVARILKGGEPVALVLQPYVAVLSVHWTIESSVHPLRAQDPTPAPSNYDDMSDKFTIDLAGGNATILAETKYRGTYGPGSGTDVDLEVDPPSGKSVCSGAGGASSPAPVDPEQAMERVLIEGLKAGQVRILVGAGDEQKCGTTFFYNNAGMVPYTLDVTLTY